MMPTLPLHPYWYLLINVKTQPCAFTYKRTKTQPSHLHIYDKLNTRKVKLNNEVREMSEKIRFLLAKLDKADRAFCFSTGMAALAAVTHLVGAGQEVVSGNDMYGGSDRLLSQVLPARGVVVKLRVDMTDLSEVAAAIGPWTKLVWLETPTNPRLQISDIRKITEIAHAHGAIVLVDNSMMSSVLSQPLELGADVVMHSATKFISGHVDVMAGVLVVKGESLAKEIDFLQNSEGAVLAPFDCWVCLRGIKTMALRVEKKQFLLLHSSYIIFSNTIWTIHPYWCTSYQECDIINQIDH
ncbi:hypothetical protein MKW94_020834 [Papaver nudicaule]|uniref:Cystathionine beta-lyase n=1 Tax=Papaver nudicaule TaxID=74823 RepID=A0AA41VRL2_PAPNU|nr:hypothetical protein [Papaver nudicaule]